MGARPAGPGGGARWPPSPADLADADLVVLPGSKSTVDDLEWLRDKGLAGAVGLHAAAGKPVLGICGGYQMLSRSIDDEVESGRGRVDGLGLLPVRIAFAPDKTLARVTGRAWGHEVSGYEIHHGYVTESQAPPLIEPGEGARLGTVFGTHWHGTFESDGYRRAFLTQVAELARRKGFQGAPGTCFTARPGRPLDLPGDLVEEHLPTRAPWRAVRARPP